MATELNYANLPFDATTVLDKKAVKKINKKITETIVYKSNFGIVQVAIVAFACFCSCAFCLLLNIIIDNYVVSLGTILITFLTRCATVVILLYLIAKIATVTQKHYRLSRCATPIHEAQKHHCHFERDKLTVQINDEPFFDGHYAELIDYSQDEDYFYIFFENKRFVCLDRNLCPPDFVNLFREIFDYMPEPEETTSPAQT